MDSFADSHVYPTLNRQLPSDNVDQKFKYPGTAVQDKVHIVHIVGDNSERNDKTEDVSFKIPAAKVKALDIANGNDEKVFAKNDDKRNHDHNETAAQTKNTPKVTKSRKIEKEEDLAGMWL